MKLLIFGMGYTAAALVSALKPGQADTITGTTRSQEKAEALAKTGIAARHFPDPQLAEDIARATHILVTAGPQDGRDPVLAEYRGAFQAAPANWVGYLSTTGVYGDHDGGWVTEETPLTPATARGRARVATEGEWQATGLPLHIFRLPGIYGPGPWPIPKGARRHRAADHQARSGVQSHSCR